jgi:hypothetical protein
MFIMFSCQQLLGLFQITAVSSMVAEAYNYDGGLISNESNNSSYSQRFVDLIDL